MSDWRLASTSMCWSVPYRVRQASGGPTGAGSPSGEPDPGASATGAWPAAASAIRASTARGSKWIVALHGMGEDADRMVERVEPFAEDGWSLLCPRAPFPVEIRRRQSRAIGHAWYQYDGDEAHFVAAMMETGAFLFRILDEVIEAGAPIVLVGFSQGAYLAYFLALRHPDRVRGVVGIAGRAKVEALGPSLGAARSVRVLHVHGDGDPLVESEPCRAAIASLAERGFDATFAEVRAGHEFTPEMRQVIRAWLAAMDWSRDAH